MSRALTTNEEVIRAQIDVCGNSVAYVASNAKGVVDDKVMWALNQAIISLQDAYERLSGEDE